MKMSFLAIAFAVASMSSAPPAPLPICLAPADAQFPSTDAIEASAAVNEVFKSYLTGPSVSIVPLTARLASQARLEARQASCSFVLFVSAKLERHKRAGGVLGQIAGHAAQDAAWGAAIDASSTTKRVASMAAVGAARAATDMAATTRAHDELQLSYRLESTTGAVLKQGKAKRKAKSDGEDLLTPLVERAAEEIVGVVSK
jgi:hypothetical protein